MATQDHPELAVEDASRSPETRTAAHDPGSSAEDADDAPTASASDESTDVSQGHSATALVDTRRRRRFELEVPWNRAKLITQLATEEKSQQTLAEEYGVSRSAIAMFKQRHLTTIEAKRENLAAEFDDLWIANKHTRLATLQEVAERLAERPDARSAEVLAKLLKDAAEELGDLPTRSAVQINTANVEYHIVGVDPSVLT